LHDDVVEIRNEHTGKFLAVDGSQVYFHHGHHQNDTKFHLEHIGGRVAFRVSYHNKYLGVHTFEHSVHAVHERGQAEMFMEEAK